MVDDTADIRVLVGVLLRMRNDFEVVAEADSGEAAVAAVLEYKPDLCLLDLVMPEMNGLEALPHVLAASPQTAVVVMTGHEREDVMQAALAAGAIGCLNKRTTGPDLADALLALLDASR